MKVRRVPLKDRNAYTAMVTKTKAFKSEDEAKAWAARVQEILKVAAAAPSFGMTPEEAVCQRFGSGGSAAA